MLRCHSAKAPQAERCAQENRMFKISDIKFDIKDAILDAYIDSDKKLIKWGVEINTFATSNEFKRWRPSMKSEVFLSTKPDDMKSYLDLSGKSVRWHDREDEDGESFGELYVFEHEPLYESTIQLTKIKDSLFFSLSSKCDVYWNEQYSCNLSLKIDTSLEFKGIWCGRKPENECRKLLEPYFSQDQFIYTKTKHGVSLLAPYGTIRAQK